MNESKTSSVAVHSKIEVQIHGKTYELDIMDGDKLVSGVKALIEQHFPDETNERKEALVRHVIVSQITPQIQAIQLSFFAIGKAQSSARLACGFLEEYAAANPPVNPM